MLTPGYVEQLSLLYRLCFKVYSLLWGPMYARRLTSIPERSEAEEEKSVKKWVPKQKHEVLKAKYLCLKKLFQVYDASLINMLPDPVVKEDGKKKNKKSKDVDKSNGTERKKKKRIIYRHNTDARSDDEGCEKDCRCIASSVMKDLKMKKCTLGPTLVDDVGAKESKQAFNVKYIKTESASDDVKECLLEKSTLHTRELKQDVIQDFPLVNCAMQRPLKLTRMQILKYHLFGRKPKALKQRMQLSPQQPMQQQYLPDYLCSMNSPRPALRRRQRLSRYKGKESCDRVLEGFDPELMARIQSVQRSCLLDTTPRVCPFPNCGITLNGIINYNDHLRLCHFPERKFVCHYCHDAFEAEHEKMAHENEHIGIFKQTSNAQQTNSMHTFENIQQREELQREEKLRKIFSYFDKIATGDDAFACKCGSRAASSTSSCIHRQMKPVRCFRSQSCINTELTPIKSEYVAMACKVCGEYLKMNRQPTSRTDLEHPKKCEYLKINKQLESDTDVEHPKRWDYFKMNRQPKSRTHLEHLKKCEYLKINKQLESDTDVEHPKRWDYFKMNRQPKSRTHLEHLKKCEYLKINKQLESDTDVEHPKRWDYFKMKRQLKSRTDVKHPKKCRSVCNIPVKNEKDVKLNVSMSDRVMSRDAGKSCVSLDCEPSATIIYYNGTSMESLCKKSSVFGCLVNKVRSVKSVQNPKWEPAPTVHRI